MRTASKAHFYEQTQGDNRRCRGFDSGYGRMGFWVFSSPGPSDRGTAADGQPDVGQELAGRAAKSNASGVPAENGWHVRRSAARVFRGKPRSVDESHAAADGR